MKALFPVSIKRAEKQKNRRTGNRKNRESGTRERLEKNRSAAGMYVLFSLYPVQSFFNLFSFRIRYRGADLFLSIKTRETETRKKAIQAAEGIPRYLFQVQKKQSRGGVYLFSYTYIFLHSIIFIHLYIFIPIQGMIFLLPFCDLSLAFIPDRDYI